MAKEHQREMNKAQIQMFKDCQDELDKAAIKTWNNSESKDKDSFICPNIERMARDLMELDKVLKMLLELLVLMLKSASRMLLFLLWELKLMVL